MVRLLFSIHLRNEYMLFGGVSMRDHKVYYSAEDVALILQHDIHFARSLSECTLSDLQPKCRIPHGHFRMGMVSEETVHDLLFKETQHYLFFFMTEGIVQEYLYPDPKIRFLENSRKQGEFFTHWLRRLEKHALDESWDCSC